MISRRVLRQIIIESKQNFSQLRFSKNPSFLRFNLCKKLITFSTKKNGLPDFLQTQARPLQIQL